MQDIFQFNSKKRLPFLGVAFPIRRINQIRDYESTNIHLI